MNVSVVIPTRGDVDITPITESFPSGWEVLVYDNGMGVCRTYSGHKWGVVASDLPDLSVYARYAAIEYASHNLIFTQDDDVIVSDPERIAWESDSGGSAYGQLVCNMPPEFRHDGYTDSCLVGFGACFHRDAPTRAFRWFSGDEHHEYFQGWFRRTCDVVFTTLTPRVLVDVPKVDREFASDPDRMWKQPEHYGERVRMLELARRVRDES